MDLKISRKTASERQRRYREQLKMNNPEKYKELKKKTAARSLEYYRNKRSSLSEEQRKEIKLQRKVLEQNARKPQSKTNEKYLSQEPFQQQPIVGDHLSISCGISNVQHRIKQRQDRQQLQDAMQDTMKKIWKDLKSLQKSYDRPQKKRKANHKDLQQTEPVPEATPTSTLVTFPSQPQEPSNSQKTHSGDNLDSVQRKLHEADEFDIYGQYVASELRATKNETGVLQAKSYINSILINMRRGKYNDSPDDDSETRHGNDETTSASAEEVAELILKCEPETIIQ